MADNSYVPVDTGEYPVANLGRFLGASKPQYEAYVTTTPIENIPEKDVLKGDTKSYSLFSFNESAFVDGVKVSPIGMWVRRGGFTTKKYEPTEEEKDELYKQFNYDKDDIDFVLDNASSMEDVKRNADLLAENRRVEAQFANSPWYMSLVGGLGSAVGNPVDIVTTVASVVAPPIGVSSKVALGATKVTANVVSGVAANQLQDYVTGIHHDVWADVGAIAGLTLGFEGLGKGLRTVSQVNRKVAIAHDAMLKGEKPPEDVVFTPIERTLANKTLPLARKMNDLREQLTSKLPSVEFKQKLLSYRDKSEDLKKYIGNLTHWEQGIRTDEGFKQRLNSPAKNTLFDEVGGLRVETDSLMNTLPHDVQKLSNRYGREETNEFLYDKIGGYDVSKNPLSKDPEAVALADRISDTYRHRGLKLNRLGLVDAAYRISKYVPVVIDKWKMHDFLLRVGGDEQAGKYLQNYLYTGATRSEERLAEFRRIWKEELQAQAEKEAKKAEAQGLEVNKVKLTPEEEDIQFNAWLWDEARKAGYGYRDQNHSGHSVDNFSDDARDFSFQKRRMPWDTSYKDHSGFSLNKLRGDIVDVSGRYFNRTAGLLAEKRVYNRDFSEGLEHINKMADDYWVKNTNRRPEGEDELREALNVMHRRAYGMAINPNRANFTTGDALADIMKQLAFSSFGTLMGILNYGEVGAALQAYGAGALIRMIPGVHETVQRWGNGLFTKEDITAIKDHLIGRELYDTLDAAEIMRRNAEKYRNINPYMAKAVGIFNVIADYSPAAQIQRYTNNTIIDTVVSCFLGEFMQKAYGRTAAHRGFLRDIDLKRVGITKADLDYTLMASKRFFRYDETAKTPMLKKGTRLADFRDDDKAMSVLRKLTNYAIEETLQRRKLDDVFTWQVANNPVVSMALQFKTFSVQSYNKRFVKLMNRWEEEGNLAALNSYLTSSALTGAITLAQVNLRALGMEDEAKEQYLQNTLGIGSIDDLSDPDALTTFLMQAFFNRNPYTASMALALNSVGIGTSAKTTAQTRDTLGEDSNYIKWNGIANTVLDMFPALRYGESLAFGGLGTYSRIQDMVLNDSTYKDRRDIARYIKRSTSTIPNIPGITNAIKSFVNDDLEDYKYGY